MHKVIYPLSRIYLIFSVNDRYQFFSSLSIPITIYISEYIVRIYNKGILEIRNKKIISKNLLIEEAADDQTLARLDYARTEI